MADSVQHVEDGSASKPMPSRPNLVFYFRESVDALEQACRRFSDDRVDGAVPF
jgi:hypothetical protein